MRTTDSEILRFLEEKSAPRHYKPGELIFSQGDEAVSFYYIKSGLSLTFTIFEDGRERNILISWPDRIFGASTFFERVPRRASAIALKACDVIEIDTSAYRECVRRFPKFQELLLYELSRDIGVLFEQQADSSLLSADTNVARFICRRLKFGQFIPKGAKPVLKYTQDFIAGVLGLSLWSVNQALADFREKGWIETGHGRIAVLDPDSIRAFAYGEADVNR